MVVFPGRQRNRGPVGVQIRCVGVFPDRRRRYRGPAGVLVHHVGVWPGRHHCRGPEGVHHRHVVGVAGRPR